MKVFFLTYLLRLCCSHLHKSKLYAEELQQLIFNERNAWQPGKEGAKCLKNKSIRRGRNFSFTAAGNLR